MAWLGRAALMVTLVASCTSYADGVSLTVIRLEDGQIWIVDVGSACR